MSRRRWREAILVMQPAQDRRCNHSTAGWETMAARLLGDDLIARRIRNPWP